MSTKKKVKDLSETSAKITDTRAMYNFVPIIDTFLHPWYETLYHELPCESCRVLDILFTHSQRIEHNP
jgi:hypothetical protein